MNTTGYPSNSSHDIDLANLDTDFGKSEVEERDFEEVPDGRYQVIVEKVEMARSKQTNTPMLKWQLKILGPHCAGRYLFRNNMIASHENLKWLKTDLVLCGLQLEKLSDLPHRLNELLDVTLEVKKQTREEYQNIYFQRRIQVDVPAGFTSGRTAGGSNSGELMPF